MTQIEFTFRERNYRFRTAGANDVIHREFLQFGTFLELPTLEVIRRRGIKGTYYDIGGNIGAHSVFFCNECHAGKVLAFEGNPEALELWRENVTANTEGNRCEVIDRFVSAHSSLSFHRDPSNLGGSFVEASVGGMHHPVKLDDYDDAGLGFIKIDVEGHELEVLQSGQALLARRQPDLCIEILQPESSGVFEFLRMLGYGWYGELSNSNHYFAPDRGMLALAARRLERSQSGLLRGIGWRLRVLAAARLHLISWSDAVTGIVRYKNARNAIRKAVTGAP